MTLRKSVSVAMHTPHEATRHLAAVLEREGALGALLVPFESGRVARRIEAVPLMGERLARPLQQWRYTPTGTSAAAVQELICAAAWRVAGNRERIDLGKLVRWRERACRRALRRHLASERPDALVTFQHFGEETAARAQRLGTRHWVLANSDVWSMVESLPRVAANLPPGPAREEALGEIPHLAVTRSSREAAGADAVFVESPRMAARLRGLISPATPLIELGQAIDLERFRPAARDYSARPLRVVQVSRLVHAKGIFTASKAAVIAKDSVQTFRVVGWEAARSPQLLAVCEGAVFTGGMTASGVVAELQRADVFVLPTVADSMPRAVLEALACGLPVITTEASSYGHVIRHGDNGFIVPEEDPGAIAALIARLAADGALRERVGRAARATAEEHTWEAMEARFARALHEQLLPSLSPVA